MVFFAYMNVTNSSVEGAGHRSPGWRRLCGPGKGTVVDPGGSLASRLRIPGEDGDIVDGHGRRASCRCVMSFRGDRLMQTHKLFRAVLVAIAALVMAFSPVAAVTDGEFDGEAHPFVGLMVAQWIPEGGGDPEILWRCSGTLISPWVFLTAGHCTDGANHVEIWFDADVDSGIPENGYPFVGWVGGTPYTYPDYATMPWYMADVGVVVLDEPVEMGAYGELPEADSLDYLGRRRGQNDMWFTSVGYGLQASFPDAASWKNQAARVRMVSYPTLIQINNGIVGDYSLLLSNNAHTGGTCFGDSGGPNFIQGTYVIAGVTSFGMNGNCAGTGGVFRLDRQEVLDWIYSFL